MTTEHTQPSPEKRLSVAICTYNRSKILPLVLESLCAQDADPKLFEVLVIDNASKDNTHEVVQSFQGGGTDIQYYYESNQGLSYARNRALHETRLPIIAYLDDDVVVEPQWVTALLETYDTLVPEPVAVGGKILLRWQHAQPTWMHESLFHFLGHADYGEQVRVVQHIRGGNMSFQTEVLRQYGSFNVKLGRRGDLQLTAEESDLQLRLRQDGYELYYQPRALVWHLIDETRLTPAYLVRRSFADGQSDAMRSVLYRWPSRYNMFKLMARQVVRFFQMLKWSNLNLLSGAERYLMRCRLAGLLGYEWQMFRLFMSNPSDYQPAHST
jgi:glycosyltransferase involved in cell wall biosynthesis